MASACARTEAGKKDPLPNPVPFNLGKDGGGNLHPVPTLATSDRELREINKLIGKLSLLR